MAFSLREIQEWGERELEEKSEKKKCPLCGGKYVIKEYYECKCGWKLAIFNNGITKDGFPIPLE